MSNFNYTDNVPVKIAEKYKPPPRIYQLPQTVTNKLNLPNDHFQNSPQYSYDFQLERKVLAKIPEYKRKRHIEREERQERRERREKEQQRRIEEQHKKMLGAVSYPNAAELSSSDSDEDYSEQMKKKERADTTTSMVKKDVNWFGNHSFNNILQPTVLTHNGNTSEDNISDSILQPYGYNIATPSNTGSSGNSNKLANTFNYKDFEDDTSSPFDNIELKTINDLDILRQVLHNTQLKSSKENPDLEDNYGVRNSCENNLVITQNTKENAEEVHTSCTISTDETQQIVGVISTLETTKAALQKIDFSDINLGLEQQPLQIDNIPTHNTKDIGNCSQSDYPSTTTTLVPSSVLLVQHYSNGMHDQHTYQAPHFNYPYSPNCNSNAALDDKILSELPRQEQFNNVDLYNDTQPQQVKEEDIQSTKSKSVPDLFQELRDEVHNSEMRRRRSRNYSQNFDGSKGLKDEAENFTSLEHTPTNIATEKLEDALESFNKLTTSVKTLARNISSMGFPLTRVARIAKIYGEDDKKIIEHLIQLTELLDLGFDETKISEALLKFDNNKEKALEHLIT